jgi:hypothetical protein
MTLLRRLTHGTEGEDVGRLHDALAAAGFEIADAERGARQFGASTAEAVRRVQALCGLEPTGDVDEKTWSVVVVVVEKVLRRPEHHGHDGHHHGHEGFVVSGLVTDKDGNPLPQATVVAYDVALRTQKELGRAQTGADGRYSIPYAGPAFQHDSTKAADLQIQVLDAAGVLLLTSDILFHAPRQAVIDLPIAGPDLGQPSEFTRMQTTIAKSLSTLSPADITEDAQCRDLTFLAGETGFPKARIALYAAAWRLHVSHGDLPPELFYGLFRMNVPADAATTVLAATAAGVDLAGNAQRLLDAALAASVNARAQAVSGALAQHVLPASYASRMVADLDRLTALSGDAALQASHGMGKTPITQVLTAAAVPADKQKVFVTTLAAATGPTRAFWKGLYQDARFTKADVANLRFAVNVGRFTKGHLPLVNALVAMRDGGQIKAPATWPG